jgi:hypothetical protein
MYKWAAIIYCRTYEVDFRLIVRPEDFGTDEIDWAKDHILTTTRSAEKLRDRPRWSLFKNQKHCIVGVTCMAATLSEDMIEDRVGRPLFAFVGYVAQPPFPPIPAMNLDLFKSGYKEYVGRRWQEKPYETRKADILSKSEYEKLDYSDPIDSPADDFHFSRLLNTNSNQICLWPDSEEYRKKLWLAASRHEKPVSLCLGLARQRDALEGSFLNATALDVSERIEITKPRKTSVEHQETIPSLPTEKSDIPKPKQTKTKKSEDIHDSQENLISGEQILNKVVEDISATVKTIDGVIKIAGSFLGFNQPKQKQDYEQQSSKSNKTSQSKNLKKQSSVPDPLTNQRDMYSRFLKSKNQQDSPEINESQEDDLD